MSNSEIITIAISMLSLFSSFYAISKTIKFSKTTHRGAFFQNLVDGFYTHNWKFIENWENDGIRPHLDNTEPLESDVVYFGERVVVFDHVYILWKVYVHRDVLYPDELDSYKIWANKWFDKSRRHLEHIFEDGDMFPLDFIEWLENEIFGEKFTQIIGDKLRDRIEAWHISRKKRRKWYKFGRKK